MRWQLGGNFGPVLKACENRWMECSYALAHYIWFEAVTDVADSLANELIIWRILAVLLIVTTIIHFMYWKKQWIKQISVTNETLKNIDFKVQDLELKISILTYKAQYDTWPLTQVVTVNDESDSESIPPTFPKLNAQNAYLKYFLARTRRKNVENKALTYNTEPQSLLSEFNVCDVKRKSLSEFKDKLMEQKSCIETILSLTSLKQTRTQSEQQDNKGLKNITSTINLSEEPTTEENLKLYRSSSDSSLNDHLRSTYLGSKKITKINIKPGKLLHRKRISPEIAEKQLKFSVSSTNNSSSSKNVFPKPLKQNYHSSQQDSSKENTHETLNQVKEKLQCLYSTLPNYSDNFESNTLSTFYSSSKVYDNIKKANRSEDNNRYYYIKNQQGDYNYDESISLKKNMNSHDTSKAVNPEVVKEDKTSKITKQSNESVNEKLKKRDKINSFAANHELSYVHKEDVSNLLRNNTTSNGFCIETDKTKKSLPNYSSVQTKQTIIDSGTNQQTSLEEPFKGSDSDDRSLTDLIKEALKFKQELVLQYEARKEKDEINTQSIKNQTDSCDYKNWQSDSDFEPNSLDKITEESSGSSVADKKSKTRILNTKENSNDQNTSNDNNSSLLNPIVENVISNNKTNSKEILLTGSEKQTEDESGTSLQNTEKTYHSNLNTNLNLDSNFSQLSDTSSDTSVNRLLDRLIESERKCKSAKSLTSAKIKDDTADPMNNFIIPHTFFDNAPFESNQNSLPAEFDTERNFTEKIDSGIESYENKNFDSTSLNTDEILESEIIQIERDDKKEKSNQNAQTNKLETEGNEISECLLQKNDSANMTNQHFDKDTYLTGDDGNVTLLSRNIDDSISVVKSMNELQNDEMENKNKIDKKDAGEFYSDSEIIAQKSTQISKKNVFPSGEINSLESKTLSKSAVKLRSNSYHSSCKGQTGDNLHPGFKNSEQCSNSIQKLSPKVNFELGNSKQFKAKSHLNLSTEPDNVLPIHRRSKSHVTSSDSPLMKQNKRTESENIPMQLDTELENQDKKMEEEIENLRTSSEVSKKSFSKPCTPQSSTNCSNDIDIQFQRKENNTSSLSSKSSSSTPISKHSNIESNRNSGIKRKPSNESLSSKSSAKSCIPTFKTRLEFVINDKNDFHPKSLSAGALKMNVKCFEPEEDITRFKEKVTKKQENRNLTELIEAKDIITNSGGAFELEYCTDSHDYVSTYINTMIDNIQLDANANNEKQMFDEYENELVKHTTSNHQINSTFVKDKEVSLIPEQDILLDSLVLHNNDLTKAISQETCPLEVQSTSSRILCYKDSKETEVLAKPCTLDTSTSMTDITSLANASDSKANELKILETPEQSTKEEYVTLFQLINDHPDFENLLNQGV